MFFLIKRFIRSIVFLNAGVLSVFPIAAVFCGIWLMKLGIEKAARFVTIFRFVFRAI
jgi:hypothetical protein